MMISSLKLCLLPLIFLLLLRFSNSASNYRDTITPNQPIRDGDTLVSSGQDFALGFFSPNNSSRRRYVGIWFNKVSVQTVVWVANRDSPVLDGYGVLSVTHQGNLVVLAHNDTVWSSNVSSATNSSPCTARLLDSGNLVLAQNGIVIWQSFDYPADTILPPMKLGFDRRTGLNRVSRSWKSRDDPGQGTYSHAIDPTAVPQAFMYKGTDPYWRIGSWTGRKFTGVPELDNSKLSNITFVDNPDEVYVTQGVTDQSVIVKVVINTSGSLTLSAWYEPSRKWLPLWYGPKDLCDSYNQCGAHSVCNMTGTDKFHCECISGFEFRTSTKQGFINGSSGCIRSQWASSCHDDDDFVTVTRVKLPDTKHARVNKGSSLEACGQECKKNCSCKAYASVDDQRGIGCITWHGDLMDIRKYSNSGQDLYVRIGPTTLGTRKVTHSQHWKWMLPLFVSVTVLLTMVITFGYCRVTRTTKGNQRKMKYSFSKFRERGGNAADLPVFFDLSTIVAATDNFSFLNKLGQGGFGPVYKGRLLDGKDIAVKRLSKNSGQGEDEFRNEVSLIAKLQHRNLVKILGCCIQEDENMLIYEYLPNKSLDFFLFDETKRALLDWPKRFGIVNGVARGMLYLHEDSRLRIIHRDLKASNVLLDDAMNPKISDFGMARIFGGDQIEGNTKRVVGTYGYMSPEYAMEGLFSIKSDVYSFGILLLEIVTGKRNSGYYHTQGHTSSLIGHIWELWTKGMAMEIVDETMEERYDKDEVMRCIQIGLLCVQECASERPTSSGVVFMLGNSDTGYQLPSPTQPAFITCKRSDQNGVADQGACSATSLTISLVEPR